MKIGQAISEKMTFKDYTILYMYIDHGQGQMTPGGQNADCNISFTTLIIHCKFQPLALNIF